MKKLIAVLTTGMFLMAMLVPVTSFAGEEIQLTGPHGAQTLHSVNGMYSGFLGGTWLETGETWPEFLAPGAYTASNGTGGEEIGAFEAPFEVPDQVTWTNRDSLPEVQRDEDLTVTWTGSEGADQLVLILGASAPDLQHCQRVVLCTERAGAGQFTVPSWILSQQGLHINLTYSIESHRCHSHNTGRIWSAIEYGNIVKGIACSQDTENLFFPID